MLLNYFGMASYLCKFKQKQFTDKIKKFNISRNTQNLPSYSNLTDFLFYLIKNNLEVDLSDFPIFDKNICPEMFDTYIQTAKKKAQKIAPEKYEELKKQSSSLFEKMKDNSDNKDNPSNNEDSFIDFKNMGNLKKCQKSI